MSMDSTEIRGIAKQRYANVRQSLTDFEESVVARYWGKDTPVRAGFSALIGSLDTFVGWALADNEIRARGEDLIQQASGQPARHQEPDVERDPVHDYEARDREAHDREAHDYTAVSTVDVMFTLPAEVDADSVALCGEFNQWSAEAIELERGTDGIWWTVIALEPGSYRYRYLLDGERWENAWQADRYEANPFGGTDSVVIVALPARNN
jgi:hypothetical protein